jgi:hypothetical protein
MHSENDPDPPKPESFTGRDILYREGAVGLVDVQRAADALLRQGRKPSVAAIREHLGGGSPNTITPLLAKYWEKLGSRLGDGPESLERVPEALARVTELLWRRALEEARERLKVLQKPDHKPGALEELQEQIGKLSVAIAEARAREGEHVMQLARLTKERSAQLAEKSTLMALLRATRALSVGRDERPKATTTQHPARRKRKRHPAKSRRPSRPSGAAKRQKASKHGRRNTR